MAELTKADYKYVWAYHKSEDGTPLKWEAMEYREVGDYVQKAGNFQVFTTIQRFAEKTKDKGEPFMAPLYFDLDYAEDPSVSQADAIKIIKFLRDELGIEETDVYLYFSGSKGFHLMVSSTALGIEPRHDLHKIFALIARKLSYRLGEMVTQEDGTEKLEPLRSVDPVVYTHTRMIRVNNSLHEKTRLYKIELRPRELQDLTLEQIKDIAKQPRQPVIEPGIRKAESKKRKKAAEWYEEVVKEYTSSTLSKPRGNERYEYTFEKGKPPVCVVDILDNGWKQDGQRNSATLQLAAYFKQAGYDKQETQDILKEWVTKHTSATSKYEIQQRVGNTFSTIDSVYEGDYQFGCSFIRSLHGPKKDANDKEYERVACVTEAKCHCVRKKGATAQEEDVQLMHLSKTGDAQFTEKLVASDVMVVGKKHTPYIVPSKIEYQCWGRKSCKKPTCPLYNLESGIMYKDLSYENRELIQMIETGDNNVKGIIKDMSGIPSCSKYNTTVLENTNVEELLVIPKADDKGKDNESIDGNYVQRRIYTIGRSGIEENKYYRIVGYVFPHPKNSEATMILKEAEPLQDAIDTFKLTDDIKASFEAFRPVQNTVSSINEALEEVLNDLSYNVTGIYERDEVLLGVLLTMHSVLRIKVPWDNENIRGWVEMKIVGDTSTGKSKILHKTMDYAGLGTKVNAESTGRTGLTYKMEQSGSGGSWYIIWGAWALADREMIWIDEDTGLGKHDYAEMTLARSEGRLEVKRAVTAETPCRVRAVFSGNPPKGKRIADYAYGVEVLKDVFNTEDIRRFDFGVFMRSTDVDPAAYNNIHTVFPKRVTSELLKHSVLYAWSRKPDHVIYTDGVIDEVMNRSTELSRIYEKANDVPLVAAADQKNKFMRLAIALATLLHSTDETGENVVVYPAHVEYIFEYLRAIYNAPGAALNNYARMAVKDEAMTDERYTKLTDELRKLPCLKNDYDFYSFIKMTSGMKTLRQSMLEEVLMQDKDDVKKLIHTLVRRMMLSPTTAGYAKTAKFNAYVAKCFEHGLFDAISDEDDY